MDVPELLDRVGKHLSVGRAFGPSYEHDGVLIVPVALVVGGGGGGNPPDNDGPEGGGFGGVVYPLGAYVAAQGRVRFQPSFDSTVVLFGTFGLLRMILGRRRRER